MTTTTARPPFDPELATVLDQLADQMPRVTPETLPLLRQTPAPNDLSEARLAEAGLTRRDFTIPGHDGAEIVVTVIAPADHPNAGPGFYHMHGGGMVIGDQTFVPPSMLAWVAMFDAVMVSVDYRLAPEFPDPYPVEDCYAGLVWTAEHAAELGIDPDRLLIAGTSAGGGLAAGTALLARDRKGPALIGQILNCPMLDDRHQTVSMQQYDDAAIWGGADDIFAWGALLGERHGTDNISIYAAPARATDLSGLPPAYVDCGAAEVLRDEGVAYATALWASGVQAELHVWPGGFHGFEAVVPHTALAQAATRARNNWITRLLAR
ncbi:lipase [Frankia sp. R43]|uniref:alpha/beta hydrolase fold domain-containing protein n=1 Tax=Frankia sp. R43 TaxID=269536 RepID=UPI0006CA4F00|nr:alpha/beta hydrolase [Frankia sp. R43]KPM51931.1 lipase [Frankia sp. R43]